MANREFHALRQHLENDVRPPPFAVIRSRQLWRTRMLAMTGVALAVVAVTVWSMGRPTQNLNGPTIGTSPTVGPTSTLGPTDPIFPFESSFDYPADVVVPDTAAPLLPTDRGVGKVSFVFANAQLAGEYVVMRDGRQFRVDPAGGISITLSPDGRWLSLATDGVFSLRDLTGTTRRATGIMDKAWSADGRYLLGRNQSGYAVLDTRTWSLRTLPGGRDQYAFGVLDTGHVVVLDGEAAADHVPIKVINVTDGSTVQSFTLSAAGQLRAGETLTKAGGEFGVDLVDLRIAGGYGVVRIQHEARQNAGYLVFSTEDGRVLRRIELPSRVPTGWLLTGTRLTAIDSNISQAPQLNSGPDFVVAIDLRDGHFSTLSRIHAPADSGYLLPGTFQPD